MQVKKGKYQFIDQTNWTEQQRKRYGDANNELEREKILEEIQNQIEDQEYKNQLLRHKGPTTQKEILEQITDSEDSMVSEHGDDNNNIPALIAKPFETIPIDTRIDDIPDDYFQLIQNVILKRSQIDYLLMKHYFDNVIEGTFVRIHEPHLKKYVMAQILAVVEGESSYKLEQSTTYKLLKLQLAQIKEPKYRHITQVSNQKLEKQEYAVWKKDSEANGLAIPTKDLLQKKFKDIQNATANKLTDEQIKKKIQTTVHHWINTPKTNIHYQDLPLFLNFMQNQITIVQSTIDRIEESIADIQESNDQSQEDRGKLIRYNGEKQEKQKELKHLTDDVGKIKELLKGHQEKEQIKQKKLQLAVSQKQPTEKPKFLVKDENQSKLNSAYMKEKDSRYRRKYDGIEGVKGSEQFKEQFLQFHKTDLQIDSIIDGMMNLEE